MVYCNFKKAFLLTSLSPSCTGSQSGPESPVKSFSSPLNPYVILFPSVYLIYSPPAPQPGFCFPQIKIQILCIPLHQTPIFWGQSLSCPHPPPSWDVRHLGFDFWPESDLLGFLERPLTYRLTMAAIINVNLWQCTTALMLMSHYSISCGTTLLFATRAPASPALLPSGADSSPLGAQFRENMAAVPALDYPEGNLG